MPIITLTTDFGEAGYHVAALKGCLLERNPDLNIIDISHQVKPYDIVQAAFILKNAFHNFPEGTIHLMCVDNSSQPLSLIAFEQEGHFFVGPDNGVFSLIFEQLSPQYFRIPLLKNTAFPLNGALAEAVEHLTFGKPLLEIGLPAGETERRIALQPVISTSQIRGSVIFIDNHDNAIVNIKKGLFEKVQNGRNFKLYFKRHDPILKLSRNYHDVPVGETLCLFNAAGHLEIAINMGRGASLLGLKMDDMVQIDFL